MANSSLTEDSIKSTKSPVNVTPIPISPIQNKKEQLKNSQNKETYMSIELNQQKHKSKKSIKKYSQTQEFKTMQNNKIFDHQFLSSPQKKSDSHKKIFSDYDKNVLGSFSRKNYLNHKETLNDKINDIFSEIKNKNPSNKVILVSQKTSNKNLSSYNLNKNTSNKIIVASHKTSKKNLSSDHFNKNSSGANSIYIQSSPKKIKTLSRNQIVKSISELPLKTKEIIPKKNLELNQANENQQILTPSSNIDNNSQNNTIFTNTQHDDSHFVLTNETLKIKDNIYYPKMMTNQSKDNFHKEMTNHTGLKAKSSSSKKQFIPLKKIEDLTAIDDLKRLIKKTSESKLIKHNFYKTAFYDKKIKSQRGIFLIK